MKNTDSSYDRYDNYLNSDVLHFERIDEVVQPRLIKVIRIQNGFDYHKYVKYTKKTETKFWR